MRLRTWVIIAIISMILAALMSMTALLATTRNPYATISSDQHGLEELAAYVEEWEARHPELPPVDIEDCMKTYATGKEIHPQNRVFIDDLRRDKADAEKDFDLWCTIGESDHFPIRRVPSKGGGVKPQVRFTMAYDFWHGDFVPATELKSWDRKPMMDYQTAEKHAKQRQELALMMRSWSILNFFAWVAFTMFFMAFFGGLATTISYMRARGDPRCWLGHCAGCGYDLRGSPGPRCSECGREMEASVKCGN